MSRPTTDYIAVSVVLDSAYDTARWELSDLIRDSDGDFPYGEMDRMRHIARRITHARRAIQWIEMEHNMIPRDFHALRRIRADVRKIRATA